MASFKVVLEIEVEAKNPLHAAKTIQGWLDEADNKWQFYVQEEDKPEVFSVDLQEDDEDAVQQVENHVPMIK